MIKRYIHYGMLIPSLALARTMYYSTKYYSIPHPYETLSISPCKVTHAQGAFQQRDLGRVVGGDWDLNAYPIDQLPKYNFIKSYFKHNLSWDEIIEEKIVPIIEKEGEFDGYNNENEVRDRYERIKNLCDNIQSDGYKSHTELDDPIFAMNYVGINIGRDGDFIFSGSGLHRLSIAKHLKIKKIPVQIWVRHKQWQEVRDHVAKAGQVPDKYKGHPDLET